MRIIEEKLIEAIKLKRSFGQSNTCLSWHDTDFGHHGEVRLFGKLIAVIYDDMVWLSDAGWETYTTKSRLNAIIRGLRLSGLIYQEKFFWYYGGPGWSNPWRGCLELYRQKPTPLYPDLPEGYVDSFEVEGCLWAYPSSTAVMAVPVATKNQMSHFLLSGKRIK